MDETRDAEEQDGDGKKVGFFGLPTSITGDTRDSGITDLNPGALPNDSGDGAGRGTQAPRPALHYHIDTYKTYDPGIKVIQASRPSVKRGSEAIPTRWTQKVPISRSVNC